MINVAHRFQADLVVSGYFLDYPKKQVQSGCVESPIVLYGPEQLMREYLSTNHIAGLVWNKLYARFLWESIKFPETKASEDNATSYKIFDLCKKTVVIPEKLYHYVQRSDSVEHNVIIENHFVSIDFSEERYSFISRKYPELENLANKNRWTIRIAMYHRLFLTHSFKKHKKCFLEWLSFFNENIAPCSEQEKERKIIIRLPILYGFYISFTNDIRCLIKRIIRR